jgi:hypothetical protein
LYIKATKGSLASMKSTLLQIKIPSFPPEIGSSGLKQMSRGLQESTRDGKSLGKTVQAFITKESQPRKLRVLFAGSRQQKPLLEEFSIVLKCPSSTKSGAGRTCRPRKQML